jgi:3-oxoacyl-[acyl-carrier protein] reductase
MRGHDGVVVVTGAESGIGYAVSRLMLEGGHRVLGADLKRNREAGADFDDAAYTFIQTDVTQNDQVQSLFEQVAREDEPIEVLFNCAGVTSLTPIPEISADDWDHMLAVNLRAVFFCSQHAVSLMTRQGYGKIINVASNAGRGAGKRVGAHYSASKAGVISLTQSFALFAAEHNITVNCVAPGPTSTPMTDGWTPETVERLKSVIPLGRFARPEEVAEAMVFLASEKADFITGETLNVNGGLLMY